MSSSGPLAVTEDPVLASDLRRLGAAAGVSLEVARTWSEARPAWLRASVVLVGVEMVGRVAEDRPARRDRVHVVSRTRLPESVFRCALGIGAETALELPVAQEWLAATLADSVDGTGGPGPLVAVVGGSGGVGASTLAAALACTVAGEEGQSPVVLVDLDRLGGGVARLVGLEGVEGTCWGRLCESEGRLGSRSLREALPACGRLSVLGWEPGVRGELRPSVVREALSAAQRGSRMVVVDLARYADPATVEALARCDDLVLVSGTSVSAVTAAAQVLASLGPVDRTHLVVRSRDGGVAAEDVSRALGIPLRAVLGHQRGVDEAAALGLRPPRSRRGALTRAVRDLRGALPTSDRLRGT